MTDTAKLDAILRKVRGLMAVADDTATTPEAAETYRLKAEALMFEYRIEESSLGTADERANITPVFRVMWLCPTKSPYAQIYRYLAGLCVQHVDGMSTSRDGVGDREDGWWYRITTCGYDSDLRYAEMLYTSFSLAFAAKMEPKVNPAKSDAENAYILRSAGWEGGRIANALWGVNDKSHRSKARRLFAQYAEKIGEDPSPLLGHGNRVSDFRESYERGFQYEVANRLQRMRASHTGGELVLASRKTDIRLTFYGRYPDMDPANLKPATPIGPSGGPSGSCERCKRAKSGYCREHGYLRPTKIRYRETRTNHAGLERGRTAAQSVDLGGTDRRIED